MNILKGPVHVRVKETWWQKQGLSFTASGYGAAIPTRYVTTINGREHRIYAVVYSNNGSLYVRIRGVKYFIDEHDIIRQNGRTPIRQFIRENRAEIDAAIRRVVPNARIDDDERRLWILNDEGLYRWARSMGANV